MAYPVNTDQPGDINEVVMGSTGSMNYIPTLYAGKLLVKFYEVSVLSDISNTDYEGQIRDQGDSVIIRSLPTINVLKHEKGMTLLNQTPSSVSQTLVIDQGMYWSFRTDDPDSVQTDVKTFINDWTSEASYELRNEIEKAVLQSVYAADGIHQGAGQGSESLDIDLGSAGAPIPLAKDTIIDMIIDCGTVLDEDQVPDTGRFFLMPARLIGLIKKSELKDASLSGDATSIIRNGMIGMIDKFKIYKTGNLKYIAADKAWHCLFGTKHAITFASQLVKNKVLDDQNGFGMLHRGLHVFGFKVVKPEALGDLYASRA